jgi:nitroreductase
MEHPKHARPDHHILDVIQRRWSPRAFDPGREVSEADLGRLFEAARWAPSSGNEQPWRFIVTTPTGSPEAFASLAGSMNERNQAWALAAPVLILVAVRTTIERTGNANAHAWYDTGQAVGFLSLQATEMGLSTRQMAGFNHDLARAACAVPAPFEPVVLVAVGYAGDPDVLTVPVHRETETQPRQRRPISDFVYWGTWP